MERLNADNANRNCPFDRNGDVPMNTNVGDYIVNCAAKGMVVYCRHGEKYITDLEKRKNSNISNIN